jgi:hypothetical protein
VSRALSLPSTFTMVRLAFFPLAALAAVAAAADQTPLGDKSQLSGKWDWKSCGAFALPWADDSASF